MCLAQSRKSMVTRERKHLVPSKPSLKEMWEPRGVRSKRAPGWDLEEYRYYRFSCEMWWNFPTSQCPLVYSPLGRRYHPHCWWTISVSSPLLLQDKNWPIMENSHLWYPIYWVVFSIILCHIRRASKSVMTFYKLVHSGCIWAAVVCIGRFWAKNFFVSF